MKTCPYCGEEIAADSKFCGACGKSLVADPKKLKEGEEAVKELNTLSKEGNTEEVLGILKDLKERLSHPLKIDPESIKADPETKNPSGFKTLNDFLRAVKDAGMRQDKGMPIEDDRLIKAAKAAMAEGADITGGFTVPPEFYPSLIQSIVENEVIRPYATVVPMKRDQLDIIKVTDDTHAASLFGGIVLYWTAEAGAKTETEPTFEKKSLVAKKLAGYCIASDEWLADTVFPGQPLLTQLFAKAIAWYEDDAFIWGTGAGQPLGFMNGGSLITVAKVAGQAADTIVYQNIIDMLARLLPSSHKARSTVWVANQGTLGQLIQLNATIGTAGVLVWHTDAKGYPQPVLMGRPVLFSEKMTALGDLGDIALCDLSYYWIGDKGGVQVAASEHYRFIYDQMTFRFVKRVDGQPLMDTAFTPHHGATLSAFVTLAERA